MLKVSDFICLSLRAIGLRQVFSVTGGAAMNLNDSFHKHFSENISYLHHEQSCSIAAEAYARLTFKPAIVCVTAGPGSINAINGVFGAYVDSIPMIVISGQSKSSLLVRTSNIPGLRQLGDQEVDIESMVKNTTKYSKTILSVDDVVQSLVDACSLAISGRPGPVWLDIPSDIQASPLPDDSVVSFSTSFDKLLASQSIGHDFSIVNDQVKVVADRLLSSTRPILYVGSGVRDPKSFKAFSDFLARWPIPVVTSWNSHDLLPNSHELYSGRPGTVGTRTGNFAVQFSDTLLVVGTRLNIRQVSYNYENFADNSWICHVDIDKAELIKPTLNTNLRINSSSEYFFNSLSRELELRCDGLQYSPWLKWIKRSLYKYDSPVAFDSNTSIDPYSFLSHLSTLIPNNSTVVCADGTACVVTFQVFQIKDNQRVFHNSGCASMGYEIPASIGAFYATKRAIYCIAGDGSIMMNIQELAIIGKRQLPIVIFLLNNKGYSSIRQTQNNFFPDNIAGCSDESGLPFPDFSKLASAFDISYISLRNSMAELDPALFDSPSKPYLVEVFLPHDYAFSPKLSSRRLENGSFVSARLEDMAPFLDRSELENLAKSVKNI